VIWSAESSAFSNNAQWDREFQKATKKYLPSGTDYRLLKAQAIQESGLRATVVSWAGAQGVMQIMPATQLDIQRENPALVDVFDPGQNIDMGAFYLNGSLEFWTAPRPWIDHWLLALAGYNAGNGNIHKAQKACGGPNRYAEIMVCLPQITGQHAAETLAYGPNILGHWTKLVIL
jgi:soluble lytic murein transglycosylase-like protein